MKRDSVLIHFNLPKPVSDRLNEVSRGPGVCKTHIIVEAVKAFLDRKGSDEIELRFAMRLDRISNQLERIERNGRIELESLALFVRYMLSVTAPLAADDEAGRAAAKARYNAFIDRVAQQIASGRISLAPDRDNDRNGREAFDRSARKVG